MLQAKIAYITSLQISNHYHIVLHIDEVTASSWTDDEVIERWLQLFKGNMLIDRCRRGEIETKAELNVVAKIIATWRARLMDISWFMRCLNESIAREANKEDNCKGRFWSLPHIHVLRDTLTSLLIWEGRFKSQALLDETALLTCMMYVDLNPIRAGVHTTLEGSDFTSIQDRLRDFVYHQGLKQANSTVQKQKVKRTVSQKKEGNKKETEMNANCDLLCFKGDESLANDAQKGLPFSLLDYFELIDWTGRAIRLDKKGAISTDILPILQKLGVDEAEWVDNVNHFGRRFYHVVGAVEAMREYSNKIGQWWMQGMGCSRRLYC